MKIRKPRITIGKKGVGLSNIGASVGGKNARVNIGRKGLSGTVRAGGASFNTRKGCSLPIGLFLAALAAVVAGMLVGGVLIRG